MFVQTVLSEHCLKLPFRLPFVSCLNVESRFRFRFRFAACLTTFVSFTVSFTVSFMNGLRGPPRFVFRLKTKTTFKTMITADATTARHIWLIAQGGQATDIDELRDAQNGTDYR